MIPEKDRALIERLNMVKRHRRRAGRRARAGIVEKEAPLHLSNLMIMCDKCNAPVRMGKRRSTTGAACASCRRCGEQLDR